MLPADPFILLPYGSFDFIRDFLRALVVSLPDRFPCHALDDPLRISARQRFEVIKKGRGLAGFSSNLIKEGRPFSHEHCLLSVLFADQVAKVFNPSCQVFQRAVIIDVKELAGAQFRFLLLLDQRYNFYRLHFCLVCQP